MKQFTIINQLIVVISIIVAMIRIAGYKSQSIQALDHLWVGGLIGVWLYEKTRLTVISWSILSLIIVEIISFLKGRL